MFHMTVQEVECVSGCGGGTEWAALALGIVGIFVAGVSAVFARQAVKEAREATNATEASLKIAQEQHGEFQRSLSARADFELGAILLEAKSGVVETVLPVARLTWSLRVENSGDKPARQVGISFAVPSYVESFEWLDTEGDLVFSERGGAHSVRPDLITSIGEETPAQGINKVVGHIGRLGRYSRATGTMSLPAVGAEVRLPFRFLAFSDDLREDVDRVEITEEVVVRRVEQVTPPF
jgi:hypothetical protein